VAFEHQQWSGTAFVADFTANATAGKRKVHGIELPQCRENFHCDLKRRDTKQRDAAPNYKNRRELRELTRIKTKHF
jgi:hypothetical protein